MIKNTIFINGVADSSKVKVIRNEKNGTAKWKT